MISIGILPPSRLICGMTDIENRTGKNRGPGTGIPVSSSRNTGTWLWVNCRHSFDRFEVNTKLSPRKNEENFVWYVSPDTSNLSLRASRPGFYSWKLLVEWALSKFCVHMMNVPLKEISYLSCEPLLTWEPLAAAF